MRRPIPTTVVFRLKFATSAFLPALADPFNFIYKKAILDKDPRWYEKNIMGSGPFKFVGYEIGQSIKGVRNPDYYQKGLPYLDGFTGIYADKQAVRVEAIRGDRAAIEFRGMPPAARDEWSTLSATRSRYRRAIGTSAAPSAQPQEETVRRRAGAPGVELGDRPLAGAPRLVQDRECQTVGGIVFPGSPLAADKEELEEIAGYWPDIEKSRAEARSLLKEAGAEGLTFELLNRNVDQPYKYMATWLIDQWSKIGLHVTQRVVPTGPWFEAMRQGNFDVVLAGNCHSVVNPLLDVQRYLPNLRCKLWAIRGPAGDRTLRQDAARDRLREAARADAPVRETRAR